MSEDCRRKVHRCWCLVVVFGVGGVLGCSPVNEGKSSSRTAVGTGGRDEAASERVSDSPSLLAPEKRAG